MARLVSFLSLLALLAAPVAARPAETAKAKARKAGGAPTVVLHIQPIDRLIADAKYLATMAGHEEEAKQFEGVLTSLNSEKGLKGIDTKRPFGLYAMVSGDINKSTSVIMAPVADEKAFLAALDEFEQAAVKGDDGVYEVKLNKIPMIPVAIPLYFRFANKYVYVTAQNKDALDKATLLEPAKVFPPGQTATLSAAFQFSHLPDSIKEIAVSMSEMRLADLKDSKKPGETEAIQKLKEEVVNHISKCVASVIKDGGELRLKLDVDRKAGELITEVALNAQEGTPLAKNFTSLGQATSLFSGALGSDSAMNMLFHLTLPDALRKAAEPVIDDFVKKALENEKDEARRGQAEKFFKALEPSLKSGDLDVGVSFRGPSAEKHYTFLVGAKLKDGAGVDQAVRDMVKNLPERDREKFKLDAETVAGVKVHRLDAGKDYDAKARQVIGEHPIYLAVRDNAVLVGAGPDGLAAVEEALSAPPKAGPQFQFELSLARAAELMAQEKEFKAAPAVAKRVFGQGGKGDDTLLVTVTGGNELKIRLSAKALLLKYFVELDKQRKGKAEDGAN